MTTDEAGVGDGGSLESPLQADRTTNAVAAATAHTRTGGVHDEAECTWFTRGTGRDLVAWAGGLTPSMRLDRVPRGCTPIGLWHARLSTVGADNSRCAHAEAVHHSSTNNESTPVSSMILVTA